MEQELSIQQMKDILLKDSHIIAVHYDPEWNIPNLSDSLWDKSRLNEAKKKISNLADFLKMPYIEDVFGTDDRQRQKWQISITRNQNNEELYNSYRFCCLRYNSLSIPITSGIFLKRYYVGGFPEIIENFCEKVNKMGEKIDYYNDHPTFQQRVESAKSIKSEVYSLLIKLSEER
jgi:hypothetical protein